MDQIRLKGLTWSKNSERTKIDWSEPSGPNWTTKVDQMDLIELKRTEIDWNGLKFEL